MAKTKRAESRARYFTRETANKKGWNLAHLEKGGDFLEEQEIISYFPSIGLGLNRPDFLLCINGEPKIIIETKNDFKKGQKAIDEAIEYAETINSTKNFNIKIAVGVAGDEDNGYNVSVRYYKGGYWTPLTAKGFELTAIPSKKEVLNALAADNSTLEIDIPTSADFIDAAIDLSNILRKAKVEAVLRPKVVGAITTAIYQGDIDTSTTDILPEINRLITEVINNSPNLSEHKKKRLIEAILLTGNDYERLNPYIFRIVSILKQLNVRAVLQSDADFLGMFYEAFLRYGYDNNAMGIVFTPRHITRLCVDLLGVNIGEKIIDLACGTGGFLVSAFDSLKKKCVLDSSYEIIKDSLYGYDTNPTVWALSCINMFFRGDGKSHIENASSLIEQSRKDVRYRFNKAFLNPPFHQADEPERDFINASMDALIQGGEFAGVVYTGVFADEENAHWRDNFLKKHTLVAMISLPDELFYPTAAPTSIMVAKAHEPQNPDASVFIAKIWNDGYEKLKGKRIECPGSEIDSIKELYRRFKNGETIESANCTTIKASSLMGGKEFSPQQWLPSPSISDSEMLRLNELTLKSLFVTIANFPEITECITQSSINKHDKSLPRLPINITKPLSYFFDIRQGKSVGEKNYSDGICPYVSSGDGMNGVVRLISPVEDEKCDGCISVSAFGTAYYQPWEFVARGNGGSAVRVLVPKFNMTIRELFWFISQINSQRWRFPYARMAIKSRLNRLEITSPSKHLDEPFNLIEKIQTFKSSLSKLSTML
ncbi:MAG: N-6 DNA methylase [Duncaniella sp.]|nr:N-6 DNA methylase [Duncaniella sp.]